ncbi:MAG: polyhydroxyalkanoate synthesis repressor PhaR [Rhodospirillales bacterium]|jgi:polyhydroxyalkanoate synthesis repressor PhaR
MSAENGVDKDVVTIKKYANRRLYNTATSSYVTLDYLSQMVKDGIDFVVVDAKSGEDLTRSVLTQIIVEEEAKGQNLLPITFLRHLISFYGDSLQGLVPRYLEHTMHSFARNQEQMRQYMRDTLQGISPFSHFEEVGKQNMAVFENAMKMFSPFYDNQQGDASSASGDKRDDKKQGKQEDRAQPKESATSSAEQAQELNQLREQLNQMQRQLENMIDPANKTK